MAKKKNTAVRTGPFAWRINVSNVLYLFLLFLALNIFLVCFDIKAGIIPELTEVTPETIIQTIKFILGSEKYAILLRAEGLLMMVKLVFGTRPIRRTLKPLDGICFRIFKKFFSNKKNNAINVNGISFYSYRIIRK